MRVLGCLSPFRYFGLWFATDEHGAVAAPHEALLRCCLSHADAVTSDKPPPPRAPRHRGTARGAAAAVAEEEMGDGGAAPPRGEDAEEEEDCDEPAMVRMHGLRKVRSSE